MMRTKLYIICVILETYGKSAGDCSPQVDMPCTLHRFAGSNCSHTNLKSHFPFYETNTTRFPGEPGSFHAATTYRYHPSFNDWYPEVNLTFTTPQNAGKNYVKGFEVMRYDASNSPVCYILDLSDIIWNEDSMAEMETKFRLDLFPLNPGPPAIYVFELYALPKQENKDDKYDQYLPLFIQFPGYVSDSEAARNWRATISFVEDSALGTINVTIVPPPSKYNFTVFEYSLVRDGSNQIIKMENSRKFWYLFKNVPTGKYQIWVKPVMDAEGVCPCKDPTGQVCDHCITTRTSGFSFTYTGLPVPVTTTPATAGPGVIAPEDTSTSGATSGASSSKTPTTSKISTGKDFTEGVQRLTTESKEVSDVKVAMAVVGTVLGIALILVIAAFIYYRRCWNVEEKVITQPDTPETDGAVIIPGKNPAYIGDIASIMTFPNSIQGINNENAEKIQFKKRPKLCLLYEDDHEYHRAVVNNFATYLQQHCQCDSMCVEWQLDAPWVHEDLEQADFVIIVNSEGAYTTYMSKYGSKSESTVVNQSSPMTRRMSSINSVRNKFLRDERYDNIVMVYFDYTDERFILPDICPGYKYRLPKHFTDFLHHIHKLRRTDNLSQYDLPLDGNHSKRPIGQKLLESIAAAENFQQQNPKWVQRRFGYDRMWSSTSDESRFDSGIHEDFISPGNTPQTERPSPFYTYPLETGLMDLLERKSVVTVNPSDIGLAFHQHNHCLSPEDKAASHIPKSRPKLSPQCFTAGQRNMQDQQTPSPPTGSTEENFFYPPDDLDDNFDVLSKTQSEQMKSIVDRYQAIVTPNQTRNQSERYDRKGDLLLLNGHNGDVPFIACNMESDVVSLGGESV